MTPTTSTPDELRAVERRITRELSRLTDPRRVGGHLVPPPPYVRRHLAEHAACPSRDQQAGQNEGT
jgi:hypothetical protein